MACKTALYLPVIAVESHAPAALPRGVPSPRFLPSLALLVASVAPLSAQVPGLPFILDDPDAHWRLAPLGRVLADGVETVAAIAPRVGPVELLVFKAPGAAKTPESLAAFADRLRKIAVLEPTARLRSAPARKIGYAGHLLSLDAPRAGGTSACTIFVFTADGDYWGLLQIVPPGAHTSAPLDALQKAAPVPAGAVALAPFRVQEDPVTSFPIGLRVTRHNDVDRIGRILVNNVPAGSVTEQLGVKLGDEILRIEGRPVTSFAGGLSRRSDLGKILLARRPGSTLELELISPGEHESRSVTLTAGPTLAPMRRW